MEKLADVLAIAAFLTTSFLVNSLIAQRKRTEDALRQSEMYSTKAQTVSRTSIVAVGCLSYFFAPPIFSFRVEKLADVLAIAAFLTTSFLVNSLIAQRKRTEDALRQSEMYSTKAQTVSRTGSFGWRVASGENVWSEETFRIFECDRAMKPTVELVLQRTHPEDRAFVQRFLERVSHDEKDWEFEHRLLMPDGSVKHVRFVAHAVKDRFGQTGVYWGGHGRHRDQASGTGTAARLRRNSRASLA